MFVIKEDLVDAGPSTPSAENRLLKLDTPEYTPTSLDVSNSLVDFCPTGTALREARRLRGLSQTDLANLLRISQSRVSAWERGHDEVPPRLRHQLIDILSNKRDVLGPIIRNMIANDPCISVHLPTMTDGFPDFKFLHIAPYPRIDLLDSPNEFVGQRVSRFFDLGWCQQTYPGRPMREKLMFDVERDVTTNALFGNRAIHRVRSQHMFLEFDGYDSLILARHTLCAAPSGAPVKIHGQLFLDQLD